MVGFEHKENSTKGVRVCSKRTICEVHRQMYDIAKIECPQPVFLKLKPLLQEAFGLGIDLVTKLVKYKCSLPGWEKNLDKAEVARLRRLRIELEKAESLT